MLRAYKRCARAGPSALARTASQRALDAALRQLLEAPAGSARALRATAEQLRAVDLALRGFSVFLRLPTGAGKSLAFQAPALAAPPAATTIVVSPLIALIQDQVAALARKGVRVLQLTGDDRRRRGDASLDALLLGQRLVYTTPEFLVQNAEMRRWATRAAEQASIARLVLDEAHCVFEWGNSFRPAYLELAHWKTRLLPSVPVTLATASVADDDIDRLAGIFNLQVVRGADAAAAASSMAPLASGDQAGKLVLVEQLVDRPNLSISVLRKPSRAAALIAKRVQGAVAIVYCLTRKECEEICLELVRLGCHAGAYHGGMTRSRREFVRKQWMMGRVSVMCATSAFGMGIDRADVRFVVHHSIPLSLSAYMQQIGRAGRDGNHAECICLYDPEDKARAENVTTDRCDDGDLTRTTNGSSQADLQDVIAFCELSRNECRKEMLYSHFGTPFSRDQCTGNCNCGAQTEWIDGDIDEDNSTLDWDPTLGSAQDETPETGASKATIEYYYQRVSAECKRQGLPKRESLSRRVIKEILDKQPESLEEMKCMKGVGPTRARLYFDLFPLGR